MSREDLHQLVGRVTAAAADRTLDGSLQAYLNTEYGKDSTLFGDLAAACREGIAQGWLCDREQGGIKFGRIIKPGPETHGFSVDVVEMKDVVGPHHRHPKGEIDMIIPENEGAEFDGHGAGWVVYGPESAHKPTVAGGRAIVLYLLPDGEIEFTR